LSDSCISEFSSRQKLNHQLELDLQHDSSLFICTYQLLNLFLLNHHHHSHHCIAFAIATYRYRKTHVYHRCMCIPSSSRSCIPPRSVHTHLHLFFYFFCSLFACCMFLCVESHTYQFLFFNHQLEAFLLQFPYLYHVRPS